ncbi:hypothetical protein D3C86_1962120 [compost metagenome]
MPEQHGIVTAECFTIRQEPIDLNFIRLEVINFFAVQISEMLDKRIPVPLKFRALIFDEVNRETSLLAPCTKKLRPAVINRSELNLHHIR